MSWGWGGSGRARRICGLFTIRQMADRHWLQLHTVYMNSKYVIRSEIYMAEFTLYIVLSLGDEWAVSNHSSEASVSTSCQRLNAFGSSFLDKHAYPAFTLANVNIRINHKRWYSRCMQYIRWMFIGMSAYMYKHVVTQKQIAEGLIMMLISDCYKNTTKVSDNGRRAGVSVTQM